MDRLKTEFKPSRAQQIRDMVEIRLASNETGPKIEGILRANGIVLEHADWSKVCPHWAIACVDEHVFGCVQIIPGLPVGYLEFLYVHPEAPFKLRAIAIRKLMSVGFSTLHAAGCNYVGGIIGHANRKFADVVKKMNVKKTFSADLYVKRLA